MSEAIRTFSRVLRITAVKRLQEHEFRFDGKRTFRRFLPDGSIQIINFQIGERFMSDQFTVNLAVYRSGDPSDDPTFDIHGVMEYHCPMSRRERLGRLLPYALAPLQRLPVLGILFGPKDKWWRLSSDAALTEGSLSEALSAIDQYGFAWLARQ